MKGLTTGFGIEYCCNNNIRYENKCYVNVKVYFKIVCVRVRVCVRPYLPFPTTHELGQQLLPMPPFKISNRSLKDLSFLFSQESVKEDSSYQFVSVILS